MVRLVVMVLHYHRGMKDISNRLTVRTAVEMQWYELHASREATKLAFDASLYSRERVSNKTWKRGVRTSAYDIIALRKSIMCNNILCSYESRPCVVCFLR